MTTGKTLYFDCAMGAAGDMLLGALFALAPAQDAFLQAFAALGLPGVALTARPVAQGEVRGVQMELTVGGVAESAAQLPGTAPQHQHEHHHNHSHHAHRSLPDVEAILAGLPVSAWVAEQARAVYGRIAAAEAAAWRTLARRSRDGQNRRLFAALAGMKRGSCACCRRRGLRVWGTAVRCMGRRRSLRGFWRRCISGTPRRRTGRTC